MEERGEMSKKVAKRHDPFVSEKLAGDDFAGCEMLPPVCQGDVVGLGGGKMGFDNHMSGSKVMDWMVEGGMSKAPRTN